MGPGSMWSELACPWQACLELAWEAYCDDCYPIGAVVTDPAGRILTRGRNRIYEMNSRHGRQPGNELAHAELEALQAFPYGSADQHACSLYTTTEPCPMCMGTFYMSGLRTLYYGARDPWAGAVDLLGKTWYLGHKPIRVHGPQPPVMENLIWALFVEQDCRFHNGKLPDGAYYERLGGVLGEAIALGRRFWESGEIHSLRQRAATAGEMFERLGSLVQ